MSEHFHGSKIRYFLIRYSDSVSQTGGFSVTLSFFGLYLTELQNFEKKDDSTPEKRQSLQFLASLCHFFCPFWSCLVSFERAMKTVSDNVFGAIRNPNLEF